MDTTNDEHAMHISERLPQAHPTQPGVMCQVPGCGTDLSLNKPYYQRRKMCREHHNATVITINNIDSRFCQQCGVLHSVTMFDGAKRSCMAALERRSARRQGRTKVRQVTANTPPAVPSLAWPYCSDCAGNLRMQDAAHLHMAFEPQRI